MALDEMIRRHLSAFGPASVQDAQLWSGLTKLQSTFDSIEEELATFTNENGKTLYDLANAPRPAADTPAPPRFLPVYDNVALAHKDRSRVLSKTKAPAISTNTLVRHVLIDGFLGARWAIGETKAGATLEVNAFAKLDAAQRRAVAAEGARLLAFMRLTASGRTVKFA